MSDPYDLYYNSIKYVVNHDIILFILAPGYTVSTWGCVVLTVFDRHRCQTIARYTGKFSPIRIYSCSAEPRLTLVLLIPFLKN